jgi:hypothetical protein
VQVKDGVAILDVLLPMLIELMMHGEREYFDAIAYPVV